MAQDSKGSAEGRIGQDNRYGVASTLEPPFSAICVIGSDWGGFYNIGTGYIFGPRTVFTVAHNVFKPEWGGMAKKVQVVPGAVGKQAPFGWVTVPDSSVRVHPAYLRNKDARNDLAAVLLPVDLGLKTGWSDLAPVEGFPGLGITVAGYGGDYSATGQYHQTMADGQLGKRSYSGLPSHDADALVGVSGGPIWRVEDTAPYVMVCGFHQGEIATEAKPGGLNNEADANVALMFNWAHYDWIQARMRESQGLPFQDWDRKALAGNTAPRPYRKPERAVKGTGPVASSSQRKWIETFRSDPAAIEPHKVGSETVDDGATVAVKATKPKKVPPPAVSDSLAFTVPSRGRHEIALDLRAGDLVAGKIEIALPGGGFTDCELALLKGRTKIDYLPMFVSSSGPRNFCKDRFSFAAAVDGEHRLVFRELNGSGAAIVRLKLKAPA